MTALQVMDKGRADGYVTILTPTEVNAIVGEQQVRTIQAKSRFLAEFAQRGNVLHGCAAAGVARSTYYDWMKIDVVFQVLSAEAKEDAADRLVSEAWRRGHDGVLEPVYQGGEQVGSIRKYSDTLLLALLRALRPSEFRDRMEHTGKNGGPIALQPILVSYDANMKPPEEP